MNLAGEVGIEPTHHGVKVRCLTTWLLPIKMVEGVGFEPTKAKPADLQSAAFGHFAIPPQMVDGAGLEPATPCL
jgi:hypothetical protein